MSREKKALGTWGEELAAKYLEDKGYKILDRNARTPYGEIDLVALDGQELVFVEVKTRSSTTYGWPEESITAKKRVHMIQSAQAYQQESFAFEGTWRIDVLAIRMTGPDGRPEVSHFENAIT